MLQAVQEAQFLRGLCIDENQQVQSKGMLWPWDTRLRLQFHLLFDCLLQISCSKVPMLMWETLLYTPNLWIFYNTFWARAKEMIVIASVCHSSTSKNSCKPTYSTSRALERFCFMVSANNLDILSTISEPLTVRQRWTTWELTKTEAKTFGSPPNDGLR